VVKFKKARYFKGLRVKMSTFVFLTETAGRLALFPAREHHGPAASILTGRTVPAALRSSFARHPKQPSAAVDRNEIQLDLGFGGVL